MRRMLPRSRLVVTLVLMLVALAVGLGTYQIVHTQQQYGAEVNGVGVQQGSVDGVATIAARVHVQDPNYHPDTSTIARQEIDYQEAMRLGDGCTTAEASAQIQASIKSASDAGLIENGYLIIIEDSGDAPLGYHLTPVAQRTPDTATVLNEYETDPNTVRVVQRLCAVGKMVATVQAGAPTPPATQESGYRPPNAVATFRAGLYAHATVIGADGHSIDIRDATATVAP